MAKCRYTTGFQRNLKDSIQHLICNIWGWDFEVNLEDGNLPGKFSGFMDISIWNKTDENKVVSIEIEHVSQFSQAYQNIRKIKNWAHMSKNRSAGLLHIINVDSNIKDDEIDSLVRYAKESEHLEHQFYYDVLFYNVDDKRATKQKADEIAESLEFKTRIWALIEETGLNVE